MRNSVRVKQLAVVTGVALFTTGVAAVANDEGNLNASLRGRYAFTTKRTCTSSPVPFTPPFFNVSPAGSTLQTSSESGIITYHGNGKADQSGRGSQLSFSSPFIPIAGTNVLTGAATASIVEFTSRVNYTVNPDGTVETATESDFTIVFPAPGSTGTTTGTVGRLQIADGKSMLVSAPAEALTVETVNVIPPAGSPFTSYRICSRSTTQTKLPGN